MQKIFAIAWKDAKIRFASKSELLFFIILPLVFTFLFAGGTPPGGGDNRTRLVVVDQAQTTLSQQLMTALEKSAVVRPDLLTLAEAESQFKDGNASVMLVIPTRFSADSLKRGNIDLQLRQQPNNLDALIAERAVQAVINRVGSTISIALKSLGEAEKRKEFESDTARQSYFEAALAQAQTLTETVPQRAEVIRAATKDSVDYDPRANTSAGQLVTWVFIPLLAISALFASERQQGTLRRLLTTPTERATFLIGTIGGQVLISLAQMLLLVTFGALALGVQWGREPLALVLMMLTFALAAAALGTTLGTFIKSEGQASGLSVMLGMVMALMGGCWYPLELFPETVQTIVKILPTTWAMQGLLTLSLRGGGLTDILPIAAVLTGFAVLFFIIGIRRFRFE